MEGGNSSNQGDGYAKFLVYFVLLVELVSTFCLCLYSVYFIACVWMLL